MLINLRDDLDRLNIIHFIFYLFHRNKILKQVCHGIRLRCILHSVKIKNLPDLLRKKLQRIQFQKNLILIQQNETSQGLHRVSRICTAFWSIMVHKSKMQLKPLILYSQPQSFCFLHTEFDVGGNRLFPVFGPSRCKPRKCI